MWWKSLILATLCILSVRGSDQAYGNRPRGVSADKAALYEERDQFKCLDGSKSIPFDQVNDDYCDCQDGSDEPGTSACSNGRFHCRNYGYRALEIPSSRVNDQICDCCDGSDEWDSGVECPNVCKDLGAQARKDIDQHRSLVEKGYAKRVELAKEGAKSMEEKKAELEKMKKELDDLQPVKVAIEASKNEAEEKESAAKGEEDRKWNEAVEEKRKAESTGLFQKVDTDKNEKITQDELKNAIKQASHADANEDDIKAIFLEDAEIDAQRFLDNHEHIKRLLKERPPPAEPKENEKPKEPKDEAEHPNSASELDEEHGDVKDDELEPEETAHEDEGQDDASNQRPDYTDETKKLIEEANKYRDQFRETSNKVRDLEHDIREAENFLQFEYGTDFAWAPLKGQCPEVNQAQYTYRLCLFDRAVQKDKNGHHEVGLGNWKGWEGSDDNKYSIQKYADGQHCWNGPSRSTVVHVECGVDVEIYDVKEPAKCEYEFKLRAPAACPDPATIKDPFAVHTEL